MEKKQHAWGWYSSDIDKSRKVKIREIHVNPYVNDYLKYMSNKTEKWDVIEGSAILETKDGTPSEVKKGDYVMFTEEVLYNVKGGPNGITLREIKGY